MNKIDYHLQTQRLRRLCEAFQPMALIVERNSMGEPLIEQLERMDLPVQPFTTTSSSKSGVIEALAIALEKAELRILDDPTLLAELQGYEALRLPSGMLRYGAPEGMHDDTVMALAFAWHGVASAVIPHIGIAG